MSRTKTEIDWKVVDFYLQAQCDGVGIAAILGIHPDTLYLACKREFKMAFSAYASQKKAMGRELLRSKQFKKAYVDDNTTMQIWLGKQYLGQSDKAENKNDNNEGVQIIVETPEQAELLKGLLDVPDKTE